MNTTIRNTALAALLFATASGAAFAADTADLSVKGVIKPAACTPTLTGGGTLDFGTIAASSLSETAATVLPTKQVTLNLSCDAATKMAVTTVDARSGTVNATAGKALVTNVSGLTLATSAPEWFGVGAVGGKNVGAYQIARGSLVNGTATADGATVDSISTDDGTTWVNAVTWNSARAGRTLSWGAAGSNIPSAYKTISQVFEIKMAIGKIDELPPLTQEIAIDGLTTFEVKYL